MLRYLITDLSTTHFTPYLLAGFNRVEENSNQSASSGWTFSNGKTTASFSTKTNMPMLGVGGIIPVTTDYGFRADIKVGSGSTSGTSNAYNPVLRQSATKVGYQGTGTFYYNLTSNVNLQLGAQWDRVSLVPWSNATNLYGVYTKLGYTWH